MQTQLGQAVLWTAILTVIVMLAAALTKTKFINKIKHYSALAILIIAIVKTYPHVIAVWGSFGQIHIFLFLSWLATILLGLWTTVFTFGGMIIASQTIDEEGRVRIVESSPLYHLLVNYGGLDPTKRNNLCALSWFGVIAIAIETLMNFVIYGIVAIISVLVWLVFGANPIRFGRSFINDGRIPKPKINLESG